jgi:hypothetical protein
MAGFTVEVLAGLIFEDSGHFTLRTRIDSRTPQESALVVAEGQGHRTGECLTPRRRRRARRHSRVGSRRGSGRARLVGGKQISWAIVWRVGLLITCPVGARL